MTITDYFGKLSIELKQANGEYVAQKCLFCDDKNWHLYINRITGMYNCKKCGAKGNIKAMMNVAPAISKSHKQPHHGLADKLYRNMSKRTIEYLGKRGISRESIDNFKLGHMLEKGIEYLTIPHYLKGELVNIKYRVLPPAKKTFRRIQGCKSILFNQDALEEGETVILCEGELDAITLIQEGVGNVVSLTCGAKSFLPQFYDALRTKDKVYLCLDNDEDGHKGAEDIALRLGRDKCLKISMPDGINDVNDLKVKEGDKFGEIFGKLIAQAKEFRIPNVLTVKDVMAMGDEEAEIKPFTPWHDINELVGNVQPGHVIAVSALPKQGKSGLCENILEYNISKHGETGLYYCIEMSPKEIMRRYLTIHFGKPLVRGEEKQKLCNQIQNKLFLGFNETRLTTEIVLETIREAIKRYGIKIVVFDHLHILLRSVARQSVDEAVSDFMREIKLLAMELQVKFILIAQPKLKSSPDDYLTSQDLKYGGSIFSDCDILILLQRKSIRQEKKEALSKEVIVRVEGSRYSAGGQTRLVFQGETMKFHTKIGEEDDKRD